MLIRLSLSRFLALAVALCAMAAWAEGPTKHLAQTGGASFLYAGLFNAQAVNVYQLGQQGAPAYQILDGVYNITGDIGVDQSQNVYITSQFVVEYPFNGLVPSFRYPIVDQNQPPLSSGLAIGKDGTVYAALYGDGVVAEYRSGKPRKAKRVLPVPSGNTAWAVAVDSSNNVYIEYGPVNYPSTAGIVKCPARSTQCTDLGIALSAQADHLTLDSQGNLLACDSLAAQVDIFPPGGGQPRTISQGLVGCPYFALDPAETQLYVANESLSANQRGNQGISVFDYASGALVNTITSGISGSDFISGIAIASGAHR